ncbi:unnamed protein product [Rhodiola kirilowii]
MGSKRPCDGKDHMRLSFKYARSADPDGKLISFSNVASWVAARQKDDVLGGYYGSLFVAQHVEECKVSSVDNVSFRPEKDIERSAMSSAVTGNIREDDYSQESDLLTYSFLIDHYPRKVVPVGREHQADVPEWDPHIITESNQSDKSSPASVHMVNSYMGSIGDDVKKFMGTCLVPMPDSIAVEHCSMETGHRGSDCSCLDSASVGCVRQHVKEARESLSKSLGRALYVDLGFLEMGEEVAHGWSVKEQQVFREVVYMNPKSLGNNFWLCLSKKFPYRSQRELVSYYYNVFMLSARATQNRSLELEIDSDDDDEWHVEISYSSTVHDEEGEDSQLESALDQDDENYSDEDGHSKDFVRITIERDNVSRVDSQYLHKDTIFTSRYQSSNKGSGGCGDIFYSSSINFASYMTNPYYISETGSESKHSEVSTTCFHTEGSVLGIGLGPGLLYDSSESLMWGIDAFTTGLDLLPTSNMIEEIFGPGSCD